MVGGDISEPGALRPAAGGPRLSYHARSAFIQGEWVSEQLSD